MTQAGGDIRGDNGELPAPSDLRPYFIGARDRDGPERFISFMPSPSIFAPGIILGGAALSLSPDRSFITTPDRLDADHIAWLRTQLPAWPSLHVSRSDGRALAHVRRA